MLGCFQEVYPALNGVNDSAKRSNRDSSGVEFFQQPTTELQVNFDPKHEQENVLAHR